MNATILEKYVTYYIEMHFTKVIQLKGKGMITEIIVKQARNGDMHAFQMLYEEIYKDMYRVAYYLLGNREDAEDAVRLSLNQITVIKELQLNMMIK